jgi:dTDP-4-dehydrorhamnose reductase
MRPVLVIGSTGFLGVALARTLRDARQSAVLAARRPHESPAAAGLERATKLVLDLRDATALERVLLLLRPRAVVLAAALARVDLCERDPVEAREVNELAPARAAALCARHGVRLVHVSTDLVFGGHAPAPGGFRPEDPPAPCSAYGGTKAAGERAVLAAHPGALVARLPLLCGESFGRGLGAGDSLLAALSRGERPRLFHDEWRTPLDVADAARALVELATRTWPACCTWPGPSACHASSWPSACSRRTASTRIGSTARRAPRRACPSDRGTARSTRDAPSRSCRGSPRRGCADGAEARLRGRAALTPCAATVEVGAPWSCPHATRPPSSRATSTASGRPPAASLPVRGRTASAPSRS